MADSAGGRPPRPWRTGVAVFAVAFAVLATTYLSFATEWGYSGGVFRVLRWAAIVAVFGAAVVGDRGSVVAVAIALVGVLAVIDGSGVADAICTGPPAAGWGVTYEWRRNLIRFGPGAFTCEGDPNRPLWLGGLFLTAVGTVGLLRGWSWPTDRDALARRLPSTRDLTAVDGRRALVALLAATALSACYLVGQGTWYGTLSWLPLAVLVVWGLAALVTEHRRAVAGALLVALGLAVLRTAPRYHCENLAEVANPATGLSVRPGALAVRYAWTGTTDVWYGRRTEPQSLACHTDFLVPVALLGCLLVAAGVVLALRERA